MNKARQSLGRAQLFLQYKPFTHGGHFWRDTYLLERWEHCVQPVVYRDDIYHGYRLLRRIGDWCWLTRDADAKEFLTIKFLPRHEKNELDMNNFIRQHCRSPFVSITKDRFRIPHHLANEDSKYEGVHFDAIVYPTTGTDLQRISTPCGHLESPELPLSLARREQCIRQIIQGVAELHRIGVVHGDIHPGNVALPLPPYEGIERFLAEPPLEHQVRRKDEQPTPPQLPNRVTEPEDLGFGDGDCRILDFGFSFRPSQDSFCTSDDFSQAVPPPPELLNPGMKTTQPFKVDSWDLGQLIYFILTDGCPFFRRGFFYAKEDFRLQYESRIAELHAGKDEVFSELPEDIQLYFTPLLLALLHADPTQRLSVQDLNRDMQLTRGRKEGRTNY